MFKNDQYYLDLISTPLDYPNKKELEGLLKQTYEVGILLRNKISIHNGVIQEVVGGSLFIKILNSSNSIILLMHHQLIIDSEVLLRHSLETLFLLKACLDDPKNSLAFVNNDWLNKKKMGKRLIENPKLSADERKRAKDRLEEVEKNIKEQSIRKIEIGEWARRASLEDYYRSVYSYWSDSVHSGAGTIDNYLVDDGEKIKELNPWPLLGRTPLIVFALIEMLKIAFESIENKFKIGVGNELNEIQLKMELLHKTMLSSSTQELEDAR